MAAGPRASGRPTGRAPANAVLRMVLHASRTLQGFGTRAINGRGIAYGNRIPSRQLWVHDIAKPPESVSDGRLPDVTSARSRSGASAVQRRLSRLVGGVSHDFGTAEQCDECRVVECGHVGDTGGGRGQHHDVVCAECASVSRRYTAAAGWPLAVVAIIRQSPGAPSTYASSR
jgi:hypothetical protein